MIAIFKREIKSYFRTVVGWLFIAAILALYGLYFYAYNLRSGYPYISYPLSAISFQQRQQPISNSEMAF